MIARLTGQIIEQTANQIILDVNGVGYLISLSSISLNNLSQQSGILTILIEMIVREDAMTLYGFASAEEKAAFSLLQSVQGVGAKAAISILSTLTPDSLKQAIISADKAMVSRADGVGPKLAQRIVNELAEKVAKLPTGDMKMDNPGVLASSEGSDASMQDALSAMVNLGYSQSEAWSAVQSAAKTLEAKDLSSLLSAALKQVGQRS